MLRIIAILIMCFIVISLFWGLVGILRGGKSTQTVRSLTTRVALAVALFLIIVISAMFELDF